MSISDDNSKESQLGFEVTGKAVEWQQYVNMLSSVIEE